MKLDEIKKQLKCVEEMIVQFNNYESENTRLHNENAELRRLLDRKLAKRKSLSTQASPKKAQSYNKCFTATPEASPKSCLDCKYEDYNMKDNPCRDCVDMVDWERKTP